MPRRPLPGHFKPTSYGTLQGETRGYASFSEITNYRPPDSCSVADRKQAYLARAAEPDLRRSALAPGRYGQSGGDLREVWRGLGHGRLLCGRGFSPAPGPAYQQCDRGRGYPGV